MNWQDLIFQGLITVSLVALIKTSASGKIKENWSMLLTVVVAFIVVYLAVAESFVVLDYIRQSIYVGLGAAGSYKLASKVGGN